MFFKKAKRIQELETQVSDMQSVMTPEMQEAAGNIDNAPKRDMLNDIKPQQTNDLTFKNIPTTENAAILQMTQPEIKAWILQSWYETYRKAENIKSLDKKLGVYRSFYDNFNQYSKKLDEENKKLYLNLYEYGLHEYEVCQLRLLEYLNKFECSSTLPRYFRCLEVGETIDFDTTVQQFLNDGLLTFATSKEALKYCTTEDLKNVLKANNLPHSGSKQKLIDTLIENTPASKIEAGLKKKYYALTDKGNQLINSKMSVFEHNINSNDYVAPLFDVFMGLIDNIDFIKNYQYIISDSATDITRIEAVKEFLNTNIPNEDIALKKHIGACFISYGNARTSTFSHTIEYHLEQIPNEKQVHLYSRVLQSYYQLIKSKSPTLDALKYYTIETGGDCAVCTHCKKLQGRKFDMKDAVVGVTYPPFFKCKGDFCRCFVTVDLKDEI